MNQLQLIATDILSLAEKATPGTWKRDICQVDKTWLKGRLQEGVVSDSGLVVCVCSDSDADAEFIAACNPAAIAALCKALLREDET